MNQPQSQRLSIDHTCRFRKINHKGFRLAVEITRRCNLKCKHCFVKKGNQEPDTNRLCSELLNALKYGCKKIIITGGEPLLNKNLVRILRVLAERSVLTDLNSNLYALNKNKALELVEAGLGEVSVSIYGNEDSHDWLTGVPGSFKRTIRGIELLQRLNIPVDVHSAVWYDSGAYIQYVTELCKQLGVSSLTFFRILPTENAQKNYPFLFRANGNMLKNINSVREQIKMPVRTIGLDEPDFKECVMGESVLGITADFELVPCLLARSSARSIDLYEIGFKLALEALNKQVQQRKWHPVCV
jgi:MoaA/NifB/PqqE/SkfB family radical SAM enzyme